MPATVCQKPKKKPSATKPSRRSKSSTRKYSKPKPKSRSKSKSYRRPRRNFSCACFDGGFDMPLEYHTPDEPDLAHKMQTAQSVSTDALPGGPVDGESQIIEANHAAQTTAAALTVDRKAHLKNIADNANGVSLLELIFKSSPYLPTSTFGSAHSLVRKLDKRAGELRWWLTKLSGLLKNIDTPAPTDDKTTYEKEFDTSYDVARTTFHEINNLRMKHVSLVQRPSRLDALWQALYAVSGDDDMTPKNDLINKWAADAKADIQQHNEQLKTSVKNTEQLESFSEHLGVVFKAVNSSCREFPAAVFTGSISAPMTKGCELGDFNPNDWQSTNCGVTGVSGLNRGAAYNSRIVQQVSTYNNLTWVANADLLEGKYLTTGQVTAWCIEQLLSALDAQKSKKLRLAPNTGTLFALTKDYVFWVSVQPVQLSPSQRKAIDKGLVLLQKIPEPSFGESAGLVDFLLGAFGSLSIHKYDDKNWTHASIVRQLNNAELQRDVDAFNNIALLYIAHEDKLQKHESSADAIENLSKLAEAGADSDIRPTKPSGKKAKRRLFNPYGILIALVTLGSIAAATYSATKDSPKVKVFEKIKETAEANASNPAEAQTTIENVFNTTVAGPVPFASSLTPINFPQRPSEPLDQYFVRLQEAQANADANGGFVNPYSPSPSLRTPFQENISSVMDDDGWWGEFGSVPENSTSPPGNEAAVDDVPAPLNPNNETAQPASVMDDFWQPFSNQTSNANAQDDMGDYYRV